MSKLRFEHWKEAVIARTDIKKDKRKLTEREEKFIKAAVEIILSKDDEIIMWWKKVMGFSQNESR